MTDKEFKRLSRADLVEIIYQLQENEEQMKKDNERLCELLADRQTKIEKAGSIAEATASLNDLFAAAQNTADDYLREIEEMHRKAKQELVEAKKKYKAIIEAANRKAEAIVADAVRRSGNTYKPNSGVTNGKHGAE